jgi:MFS family permease
MPGMSAPRTANIRNLVAACSAITVFGFSFGMSYPLMSLILESRGVSSDMIGINSAMMPLGILLFSPVIPVAARRIGARNVAIAAAVVTALVMVSYKAFDSLAAWFVIRLVQGMSMSVLFVLSEAWIVGSAGDRNRGKVVAIYACVLSASFGAGPLMLSFIGIEGWTPFALGAGVIAIGTIPLFFIREDAESAPEETHPSGVFDFAPKAPMLLFAVASFSVFDAATLSLFPVYAIQNGLDIATSANILTALILGNMVLQIPVGWLADRFPHRWVLAGCSLTTSVTLLVALADTNGHRRLRRLHGIAGLARQPLQRRRTGQRHGVVRHRLGLRRADRLGRRGLGDARFRLPRITDLAGADLFGAGHRYNKASIVAAAW